MTTADADAFPYRLHYSGTILRLAEPQARQVFEAIKQTTEQRATAVVQIDYLLAGEPLNMFILGPGIPVMLTGPAFTVADIVDR